YDFNVSGLRKASKAQGAFELALTYEFGEVKTKQCPKCPSYVLANVETIVRVKYEDADNNLVDTIINRIVPADSVPRQYIDSIELILKPIAIKAPAPSVTVVKTTEKIMSMLPIELYFDNDMPKQNSKVDYGELYNSYTARKATFESKSVDGAENVGTFFSQIDKNFQSVSSVVQALSGLVDSGYVITLEFRGYTSPLASESYNKKLSERRINSIIAYFDSKLGEQFKILSKTALAIPFGETLSPKEISDNGKDRAKSEFGVAASKQRKVEIVGIRIEKP
ncbi:MAG TPA: hypothetical protein PK332_11400, partial [Chitinophagales bacterium]|nr:hypothetical protein [Chitinophagales bacterium]